MLDANPFNLHEPELPQADANDLFAYLDDLSHEPQQYPRRAEVHSEGEYGDTDEYTDVALPWSKHSDVFALRQPNDSGTVSANSGPLTESPDNQQQHIPEPPNQDGNNDIIGERVPTAYSLLSASRQRSQHSVTAGPVEVQWRVDLDALLGPSTNGTLEKFHLLKWKET